MVSCTMTPIRIGQQGHRTRMKKDAEEASAPLHFGAFLIFLTFVTLSFLFVRIAEEADWLRNKCKNAKNAYAKAPFAYWLKRKVFSILTRKLVN